jgi:hypothetical protein
MEDCFVRKGESKSIRTLPLVCMSSQVLAELGCRHVTADCLTLQGGEAQLEDGDA